MQTHVGNTPILDTSGKVEGEIVEFQGESFYKIANVDQMRPFFMSLVSDGNHWMFISSNGGLTAGRKNSEFALFPYYTDDKITESVDTTGCKTLFRVASASGGSMLWEPFSERYSGLYNIRRNLYKNRYGNTLIFEEENLDLGLVFQYQWETSNRFGFVRKARLCNTSGNPCEVHLLDGFLNLVPHGVTTELQNTRSNLVDAYKKSELLPESGLGIYALSAIIVDRAEPSEALKANVVWSAGLESPVCLVSARQVEDFRHGVTPTPETLNKGEKGAYLAYSRLNLDAGREHHWTLVANVNQGPSAVADLHKALGKPDALLQEVESDIRLGTEKLMGLAAAADGLQLTADPLRTMRHYANVMYNIMRGGIMDQDYLLEREDLAEYIRRASQRVSQQHREMLSGLPEAFTRFDLLERAGQVADADLMRLCLEYLPLKFSRRHGDPSRPWNKFSINTQRESDGAKILDYQGNWRDIFQNWEALAHSYPGFIHGMIHKFLNASTADGYNPYRITKYGVDWEVIEPDDPWSYIGYWGDHQVIYLLKFLEFAEDYEPGRLMDFWETDVFVYVDVPYRIKSFDDILQNPKDTIVFDAALDKELRKRMSDSGSDGVLLRGVDGQPYRVNLVEKLLAMLLAKVSNFVPEAGIWLNTQRPEWNDANNALVGNGVSMVTLYYLHRFLNFLDGVLDRHQPGRAMVSKALLDFFDAADQALKAHEGELSGSFDDVRRMALTETLGRAGEQYRASVYQGRLPSGKSELPADRLAVFVKQMLRYTAHSIAANRRKDQLFHSYNLIDLSQPGSLSVSYLDLMLEGQVAVLSSGYLDAAASADLMDALRSSALYRKDQNSYILYPNKDLPPFTRKNLIPEARVAASELLKQLLEDGDRSVIEQDSSGGYHFNGAFNNASRLAEALDCLPPSYAHLVAGERKLILETYEELFDHRSFTGRSGTFFGYEGLGSIYWHMVSKLSLAVLETCARGQASGAPQELIRRLERHYHEVNAGIGVHKSPGVYGAFPTDPYSHTPAHRGAQQPGMTGQVKEDVLTRLMELGVRVQSGAIAFGPFWFDPEEWLGQADTFVYRNLAGNEESLALPAGSLAFTYCQVPIVYHRSGEAYIEVHYAKGKPERKPGHRLDPERSAAIFKRSGEVVRVEVGIPG
ncbi:hypothetical protein [Robiginitalea sediminis]|uniref:hypothetical protein n=1 Tax=Robiginitalea sediminis TaxID=1982593 RepID=UPI000B4BCA45|nr:hypothetical protein [Robiginitalea sediminis]